MKHFSRVLCLLLMLALLLVLIFMKSCSSSHSDTRIVGYLPSWYYQCYHDVDFADLRLLAYAPDGASYEYYTDDGETKDNNKPEHFVHITLVAEGNAKCDGA